jgi:hypothetical protein
LVSIPGAAGATLGRAADRAGIGWRVAVRLHRLHHRHIFVAGGTVSAISLGRSGVALACPSNIFIPVAANDTVTVTYSVLPTMTFIPSARA